MDTRFAGLHLRYTDLLDIHLVYRVDPNCRRPGPLFANSLPASAGSPLRYALLGDVSERREGVLRSDHDPDAPLYLQFPLPGFSASIMVGDYPGYG